jgi:hypothetical protein
MKGLYSLLKSVHVIILCLSKINFNITHPLTPNSPRWTFTYRFSTTNLYACEVSTVSRLFISFTHSFNNNSCRVACMKLLVLKSSPLVWYFFSHSYISAHHRLFKDPRSLVVRQITFNIHMK